jgi:hypothetical protein
MNFCNQPAGARHCPWNDNGYCHYYDDQEERKRKLLQKSNGLKFVQGVCNNTKLPHPDLVKGG